MEPAAGAGADAGETVTIPAADEQTLHNERTAAGPDARPVISIDRVSHGQIAGWASNPACPNAVPTVRALIGGELIAEVRADRLREDAQVSGRGSGRNGFILDIPPAYWSSAHSGETVAFEVDGIPVAVRSAIVVEAGIEDAGDLDAEWAAIERQGAVAGDEAPGGDDVFAFPAVAMSYGPAEEPATAPLISIDRVSKSWIAGWAADPRRPEEPAAVRAFLGPDLLAEATADRERDDVRRAGLGSGLNGFVLTVPPAFWSPANFGRPVTFEVNGFPVRTAAEVLAGIRSGMDGAVERQDQALIHGWAADPFADALPEVELVDAGGKVLARTTAGAGREDGGYAFSLTVPKALWDGKAHALAVRIADSAFIVGRVEVTIAPAAQTGFDDFEIAAVTALFDKPFYTAGFPRGEAPADPVRHYLTAGWKEGRDPAPWFSTWHYLSRHRDVADAGMNPFLHYCLSGKGEGRALERLGQRADGDVYAAQAHAVAPGPDFEEFDPTIGVGRRRRAKVLAYYLPQFHPIAVNDAQWGAGFTEWRQLPRAMPRFMGHVQPRIPRDLGCYSLAEGEAMRRQIEMAKAAGLFGFCFYHYWFDGRRVLETPMERFLADPSLDFPFCLMWANENWTRTWDGFESEVILRQSYRDADEIPFIDDLARHMKDARYIRIGDRPLFFIYRPGQVPEPDAAFARWRQLFRDRHGLDPIIMMAQGFGDLDPNAFGLDGAIEFPPHKVCQNLPAINATLDLLDPDYQGHVVSYDAAVERSCSEEPPGYPLIRTVTTNWDNEPRRPGRGMVLHGATPQKFAAWVTRMIAFAQANPVFGESFVCVNAWNEWAEGAVLEPDVHYGAAYLNALSRAVHGIARATGQRDGMVIVGHDANINGAQMLALHIGQTLTSCFGVPVRYVLADGGPLISQYRAIGPVDVVRPGPGHLEQIVTGLAERGYRLALTNTTPSGRLVPALKAAGFNVVSLIHELPNLLRSSKLEEPAQAIAELSDRVIFPAGVVRDGFERFAGPIAQDAEIFPQGLYNIAVLEVERADHGVREELNLPPDTRIVLGVGYADLRKGVDRFVSAGLSLCARHADIAFVWVGAPSDEAMHWFQPEIAAAGLGARVHILGHRDDVARFFAAADAFYLASREDPFPSVVLEALAVGLPVIGHQGCGGCDDLIARHGRLVPSNDPLAAAHAVLDAITGRDPEAEEKRRTAVRQTFDFGAYVFGLMQRLDPALTSVSAIVPNYNYDAYIGDRLRSVFDQTYPLREVIVLDDASPDGSVAEIERTAAAAGRTIALHVNAKNSGSPFPQWRRGVELAQGDYVWIAEADDLAEPAFVARLIERMQRAGSVLGFTDSRQIDETGEVLGESYRPYVNEIEAGAFDRAFDMDGPEFLARFLAVKNVILNVSGAVFRRDALLDAFAAVGEDLLSYRVAGDWRLYTEICAGPGSRVSYLPDALNAHRRHKVSVTHALDVEKHLAEIAEMHQLTAERAELREATRAQQSLHFDACRAHLTRAPEAAQ